jgi:hypothetical protein
MRRLMSVLSVGLLGTCAALAQQDIVSFTGLGGNQAINGNYTLGYEFSVTSPITVSALSDFASGVASGGTAVGLWNASGTEIASTAVTPSDLLTSDGYFRFRGFLSRLGLQPRKRVAGPDDSCFQLALFVWRECCSGIGRFVW